MELPRCNIDSRFLPRRQPISRVLFDCRKFTSCLHSESKLLFESRPRRCGFQMCRGFFRIRAMDDDSFGGLTLDDLGENQNRSFEYTVSSSEGEDSDGEIILHTLSDVDLPTSKGRLLSTNDSITVTAHRLVSLGRTSKTRSTTGHEIMNTTGLALISTIFLLFVDHCAWRIVRLPLPSFFLMRPFLLAVVLVSLFGHICLPLFRVLKLWPVARKGASQYSSKKGVITKGGVFFVPIGVLVVELLVKFSSTEVFGVAAATILFTAIGLLCDYLDIHTNNKGVTSWIISLMEVAVISSFSYWMYAADISTPYSTKMVVPLPHPWGLVCASKVYPILTSISFISMVNGVSLTDGFDGLGAGTAALLFIGMSIVVLPISSELSIFGASMAGACIGFVFQSQFNNSMVVMGDTGALAVGGALAAMASCTGMFLPLLIASGVYIMEMLSLIIQISSWLKEIKYFDGKGSKLVRVAPPLHRQLVLCGIQEPVIVSAAYFVTSLLVDLQYQGAYLKRLLKKLIVEIESSGGVVLDELFEQYASYMVALNDWDHSSNVNTKVLKKISFIFPETCGYTSCADLRKLDVQLMCSINMLEGDTGCCIWPSSLFLSEFILSHPEVFANKCCFELGSGVGLVGICLSYVKASKVILSDGDLLTLANMKCNLKLNNLSTGEFTSDMEPKHHHPKVHYLHLPWEESTSENHLHSLKPDVILGADIIYDPSCLPHLIRLLAASLNRESKDGHSSARDPVAYIACVVRNMDTFECFVSLAKGAGLSVSDITDSIRVPKLLPFLRSYQRCTIRMMKIYL